MIRTGEQYIESIRDGREVYINGNRVQDVPTHPTFKPLVEIRARIYDMQHEAETAPVMTLHALETKLSARCGHSTMDRMC